MRIGNLEIPQELLDDLRDGRLVVFAGAGVSMPAPTSLPSFRRLAEQIGQEAGVELRRLEPLDMYLGRALATGSQVHRRVAEIISAGGVANALHEAVVGLFPSSDALRVVTTNFDRHLWEAACNRWKEEPREYVAPALPYGGDARGIVYLHGAAHDQPEHLVVTDRDFGSAYLTRGHATRFLLDLYANNTVLFVGYSHSDPVLTYLARGLPPTSGRRYALARRGEAERWRSLSIQPIELPKGRRDIALRRGLGAWGTYNSMGFADHQHRLRELLQIGPSPDREALDYIRARIEDQDTTEIFCREATESSWLDWFADEPLFQQVFAPDPPGTRIHSQLPLAVWIAGFMDRDPAAAMKAVVKLPTPLPSSLWQGIARSLWRNRPSPDQLRLWLAMLLASAPRLIDSSLAWILDGSRPGDDDEAAAALFAWLSEPVASISPAGAFGAIGGDPMRVEMSTRGEPNDVLDGYQKAVAPRPEAFARSLLPVVGHHLASGRRLVRLSSTGSRTFDADSFRRSAIEPHPQDDRGGAEWTDALIDCGRDLITWACQNDAEFADAVIEEWARADSSLLQRLATFAVSKCLGRTADDRIAWLIKHDLLFSTPAQHEVFTLLRLSYAGLSEAGRGTLLAAIDAGSTEPPIRDDDDLAVRVRFDRVDWLLQAMPGDSVLVERRDALLRERPDMAARDHPDFLSWMEAGFVPGPTTTDVEAVLQMDPKDAATITALGREPGSREFFAPTVEDLVAGATRERPAWAIDLAETLADGELWELYLWDSIADALSESDLDPLAWERVLRLMERHPSPGDHLDAFARLLERGLRSSPPRIPAALLPRVEALAYRLWPIAAGRGGATIGENWLSRALNHPAGQLALVMIQLLSLDRPIDGQIQAGRRIALDQVLSDGSEAGGFARAVFASQLHFLRSVDRDWTLTTVVPWFDRARDPLAAAQAWSGFLTWGRLDADIAAILLESYRNWFGHEQELGDQRDRFAEHLAALPFLVDPAPVEESWVFDFVRTAEIEDLQAWVRHVGYQLDQMSPEGRLAAFQGWLGNYWRLRIAARPRSLTPGEAGSMLRWALRFEQNFETAVGFAVAMPVAQPERMFVHELERLDVAERYSQSAVILLEHALRGEVREAFWECAEASNVARRAISTGSISDQSRASLLNQLLRLGCSATGL